MLAGRFPVGSMSHSKKKTAEHLGTIRINNGQNAAELVRERDPGGATVVHAVKRSAYVHERLRAAGKLASELFDAGEKFRADFERAQLSGNYARLDMFKTRAGKQEITDTVAAAKTRIGRAIEALGRGREGPKRIRLLIGSTHRRVGILDRFVRRHCIRLRQFGIGLEDGLATILKSILIFRPTTESARQNIGVQS